MDLQEKSQQLRHLESEFRESHSAKTAMKSQLDDYELKVKKLIRELEDESKKHIKEINDVHDQYRGFKFQAKDLDDRIKSYQ